MAGPRVIIPSMNLRDLGGYEAPDGRRIAPGVLLRGGHMAELSPAEVEILAGLGLRTIVDLRRPSEISLRPTPILPGVTIAEHSVSDEDNEFAVVINNLHDPEIAASAGTRAAAYYRDIVVTRLERYRPVFAEILHADRRPVLFHCTAGKDRTGFVAATVLELLGVPTETVFADYLLTNEVRAAAMAGRLEVIRAERAIERGIEIEAVPDAEMDAIRTLMFVDRSFLEATYAAVAEHHGSWTAMAESALGLDHDTLERFRDAVLV